MKPLNVGRYVIAAGLILTGLGLLSDNLAQTHTVDSFWTLWPLIPLALGVELVIRALLAERAAREGRPAPTFRVEPGVVFTLIVVILVGFVGTLARPAGLQGLRLKDLVEMNVSNSRPVRESLAFTRDFAVGPGTKGVTVRNPLGEVIIQPGAKDKVAVEVTVNGHAQTPELARKAAEDTKVEAAVAGSQVGVTVTLPEAAKSRSPIISINSYRSNPADATVKLTIPEGFDVTVDSSFGNVDVSTGRVVKVTNQFGRITVTGASGDVTVSSDFGQVTVTDVAGSVAVKGPSGEVNVARVKGSADVQASFGSLELDDVAGKVDARTSNGAIHIRRPGQDVSARTSFGLVEIVDPKAAVSAHTSNGSIEIGTIHPVVADYDLDTSFGSVQLSFPKTSKVTVHAETKFGAIRSDLGGSYSKDSSRQTYDATLNGGGARIVVETSSGRIELSGR